LGEERTIKETGRGAAGIRDERQRRMRRWVV
jgi:hypothetical protein